MLIQPKPYDVLFLKSAVFFLLRKTNTFEIENHTDILMKRENEYLHYDPKVFKFLIYSDGILLFPKKNINSFMD